MTDKVNKIEPEAKNEYLNVNYGNKPFSNYPDKLIKYLIKETGVENNGRLLDLGCGRGEFLNSFIKSGFEGYGIDQSDIAKKHCPDAKIVVGDLEEILPFEDSFFDVVYSKSLVEHFYYPEKILREVYRILKPGGIIITMTPNWKYVIAEFYSEFTHRTPFTKRSLQSVHEICGFKKVKTKNFIQLPFFWKFPRLTFLVSVIRILTPKCLKNKSKLIRFSKEIMLLTTGVKN
tara:strand:- start:4485 stop:5180 length:696 start_codon:yes stop_codon:yes gene_type:complete